MLSLPQAILESRYVEAVEKQYSKPLRLLVSNTATRKRIIKFVDKKMYEAIMNNENNPYQVQKDRYSMGRSLVLAMEKAYENAEKAPNVRKAMVNSIVQSFSLKRKKQFEVFQAEFHRNPPFFLTISPTKFCNLKCDGCYASSSSATSEKLEWGVLEKIMAEKTNLWGSYFTVISGGEPFLYKSRGKTIIDIAKQHPDNIFLVYTNGTLINKEMAKSLAEVGNITPAISVEGFEKETDERRGSGTHKKVLEAMANLREVGVPFGISFTATRNNADLLLDDKFVDYYFNECGAVYGWIFQLMPIGRSDSLDLMVTPEQRVKMFKRTKHLVEERKIFIADFWNSGCTSNGCISAGRQGGYLYIDWNGNVTPCVFNPYSPVNINDVYKTGGTLNDVIMEPFFESIRQWQKDYALDKKPNEMGNWLIPCAIKDHYDMMEKLLDEHQPKAIDEAAQQALHDPEYKKGLKEYGKKVAEATDPIWEYDYLDFNLGI